MYVGEESEEDEEEEESRTQSLTYMFDGAALCRCESLRESEL